MSPVSSAPPLADPDALVFQWERRSWSRLRLVPMLFLSLLAHAASFYVLQVAYTPTGSQLPPPAQVVLVPLDQPENAPLARWLAMTDPALMSRPATPSTRQTLGLLGFRFIPSYEAAQPGFKPLDSAAVNGTSAIFTPPRPRQAGPLSANLLPPLAVPTASFQATGPGPATRVVFSGEAAQYAPADRPPVRFAAAKGAKPTEPAVFLVGVRSSGGVPLLFRQPGLFRQAATTDAEAQEYARAYLSRLTFRAPPAPAGPEAETVVWGWATFYWGK